MHSSRNNDNLVKQFVVKSKWFEPWIQVEQMIDKNDGREFSRSKNEKNDPQAVNRKK